MRHPTEGERPRGDRDPDAILAGGRSHLARGGVREDGSRAIAEGATPSPARFERRPAGVDARAARGPFRFPLASLPELRWRMPVAAVALVLVVVAAFTVTPFAATLRGLFGPTPVQPVTVTRADRESRAPLRSSSTERLPVQPQGSAAASGLPPLHLGSVPSSVAGQPVTHEAISQGTVSFTFGVAKAAAAARSGGVAAPQFPAGVEGSSLVVRSGPGEVVIYGNPKRIDPTLRQAVGARTSGYRQTARPGSLVVAGEMRAPAVSSKGASVAEIKQTLLAEPGLTAPARALITELDNPDGALPLPVPAGLGAAQTVTVQGLPGQAFGDATGSAVVWIKGGVVWFLGGTLAQSDALAAAQTLS